MHFTPAARTAAAALSALAVLLAPTTAHAAPADHLPRHAPGDTITLPVRDALQALIVQDESHAGYERSKFKHTGPTPIKTAAIPAPRSSWRRPSRLLPWGRAVY
ncbi:hypothetical protein ACFV2U_53815 [Streptomyces sp. NPDC059697]|uniref:hypothetical protein n=1 Tax=Streptomyces sp. NPDC059697 TaxID=3346912 RepID=UPI0036CE9521